MIKSIRDFIFKRRLAYRQTFMPGGISAPAQQLVLDDLRKFCRANTTPAVYSPIRGAIDPVATGIAIGRLEVWHRIAHHLHMSDADLYKIVEQPNEE